MHATLYVELTYPMHNPEVRNFVKDTQVDGAITLADEIQLVSGHGDFLNFSQMMRSYVIKISDARIRRIVLLHTSEPWLFLFWEKFDFTRGDIDELRRAGWSETHHPWENFLLGKVGYGKPGGKLAWET